MDANMMTAIANAVLTTLTDEQLKSEIIRRGYGADRCDALFDCIGDEYKDELVRAYMRSNISRMNHDLTMDIIEEADTDTLLGVIRGRCRS